MAMFSINLPHPPLHPISSHGFTESLRNGKANPPPIPLLIIELQVFSPAPLPIVKQASKIISLSNNLFLG